MNAEPPLQAPVVPGGRPCAVLATSNGTGMGHLARQAAVGHALAHALAGKVEPVVFSLSAAAHVVTRHGMRAEYCPSHHRGWIPHPLWHGYLRDRVGALLDELDAKVFAFDGVAPYLGLLRARAARPDVAFVWIRRGLWRPGRNTRALAARRFFDLVIEPGELAAEADQGPTAALDDGVPVGPITILEQVDQLPREQAAAELGLDPNRPAALVTLGAGSINDPSAPGRAAVHGFLANPAWQVAVTRAPLAASALSVDGAARVHELVGVYPLARYLNAFDAAVSAAGYNATHELLLGGVPTVLVPNPATTTDDQVVRARWAVGAGLALYAEEGDPSAVTDACRRLLHEGVRKELVDACAALPRPTGAAATAGLLAHLARDFGGHTASTRERLRTSDLALREAAMRGLGTSGTALVRRALGRVPGTGPSARLAVEPQFTDAMDRDLLRGDHPVEHLVANASPTYRERREAIARRVYRWPDRSEPADEATVPDKPDSLDSLGSVDSGSSEAFTAASDGSNADRS